MIFDRERDGSVTMEKSQALGYDWAGNVTQDNLNAYLYDGDGRVCAVQSLTTGAVPRQNTIGMRNGLILILEDSLEEFAFDGRWEK
jgi:hypothetical protein